MKSKRFLILAFCLLSSCFFAGQVLAGTATVSWNANTESDLAGYKIYYGTTARTSTCPAGGYASSISVGNVTSYTFPSLTNGATYYFSVTAIDTAGLESCFSSEVTKVISSTTTKKGDLNNDAKVDVIDLGIFLANWGVTTKPASDINQDGKVDVIDLGILLGNWG